MSWSTGMASALLVVDMLVGFLEPGHNLILW